MYLTNNFENNLHLMGSLSSYDKNTAYEFNYVFREGKNLTKSCFRSHFGSTLHRRSNWFTERPAYPDFSHVQKLQYRNAKQLKFFQNMNPTFRLSSDPSRLWENFWIYFELDCTQTWENFSNLWCFKNFEHVGARTFSGLAEKSLSIFLYLARNSTQESLTLQISFNDFVFFSFFKMMNLWGTLNIHVGLWKYSKIVSQP